MLERWSEFESTVAQQLKRAPAEPMALVQMHLRRLRGLRGLIGQPALESALAEIRRRIRGVLRAQDIALQLGEADVLLALPGLMSAGHARLAAHALMRALSTPLDVQGLSLRLQPELGIALYPQHGDSVDGLQRAASAAVERARTAAGNLAEADGSLAQPLFAELAIALRQNALTMVFQPIQSLSLDRRVGYEALARWLHPRSGEPVSPALFVPHAEEAGLVPELTRWSLQTALREFHPLWSADPSLHCALNLSARAFEDSALSEQIEAALAIWNLPPAALLLEITETALLAEPQRNAGQLSRLRALGVRVALDDFGQGYSSFGYLQFLEVNTLKIDRRFLERLDGPRERGLVQSMIELAHRLDMAVVAEGVEDHAVHQVLLELGCDEAQGWLYGRPQPAGHWLAGGS